MHRHRALLAAILGTCVYPVSIFAQSTYDVTTRGASCKVNAQGLHYCSYRVGSLEFGIVGLGGKETTVHFLKSDIADDYYAQLRMQLGCVVVLPGTANDKSKDKAFVSTSTGKVFRSAEQCKESK